MNKQITRLAVFSVVLIAALIVASTYWQSWAASSLAARQDNAIERVAQFTIDRGKIYASDGRTLLAGNVRRRQEDKDLYFRRYPQRGLAAHAVGYSTQARFRTGLERSLNDYLTGANSNLATVVDTTLDKLKGATIRGNDVVTTIRSGAQRVALNELGGRCGAVAVIDIRTGRVVVLASSPTYNPNLVERNFNQISRIPASCGSPSPLLNRATRGLYPPGSIFKVVTAAAALDSGAVTPEQTFNDPGYCIEYGKPVNNYDTSSPFGNVSFAQAMQYSINSVFCNVGKEIGPLRILDYAERLGFYSKPQLETPDGELAASGLYQGGKPFKPKDPNDVDPGRLAFGQERMLVTPLQMAMVAATVANGGELVRPRLVQRIDAPGPSKKVITRPGRGVIRRAIKPETAAALTSMMEAVVSGGTGTAAALSNVSVAGKTGTAETGVSGRNYTWFIAFAPSDQPRYAIAVVLEEQSGTGGTTAAPIARSILQALLPESRT